MLDDKTVESKTGSANRDPLSGAPGAHPVGVGVGAAAGGMAAGAAVGTVAGPLGTAVGAAVGAVIGGLAGKGVAESIDPTVEDAYWRENYASRDYVAKDRSYDDYGPAYGYGVGQYQGDRSFEDVEPELGEGWNGARGQSTLAWDDARPAARDAWDRIGARSDRGL
ncbi:MAG: hypothetical protein JWQ11_3169 [Rhizobacter sp.]|nr:hypothetical protein [Rhizobacter sp.]